MLRGMASRKVLLQDEDEISNVGLQSISHFHEAIRQGQEEMVLLYLDSGMDVDASVEFKSPLESDSLLSKAVIFSEDKHGIKESIATENNQTSIARLLIEKGCCVNFTDRYLNSPIILTIQLNNTELFDLLLSAGANLKHKRLNGCTPLHEAVTRGRDLMVSKLLSAGADVHSVENGRSTPLHLACLQGRENIARMLLDAGSDVNITMGPKGVSAIHLAAHHGSAEIIKMLVEAGADVNVVCKENFRTAIHFVCMKNNLEALNMLLSYGCDVNVLSMENEEAKTPLIKAIDFKHIEIIERLIDAGADLDLGDHYGVTPLITAIFKSNAKIVSTLLRAGCDVNKSCRNGLSSFTAAMTRAQYNMGKMLLIAGYRMTAVDLEQLQKLPVTETMSAKDLNELLFLINEAPSLKRLCRLSLRRSIGRRPKIMYSDLPLPQSLSEYLNFPELGELIPYAGSVATPSS